MPEKKVAKKATVPKKTTVKKPSIQMKTPRVLSVPGGYFKGAWYELRQVRWPDRKATWGLTLAVIIFSIFFAVIILGLDYVFQYLFKEIIL